MTPKQFANRVKNYSFPNIDINNIDDVSGQYKRRLYLKKLDANLETLYGKTNTDDPLVDTGLLSSTTDFRQDKNKIEIVTDDDRDEAILDKLRDFYGDPTFELTVAETKMLEDFITESITEYLAKP